VNSSPRLTSIAGVARALIATVGVDEGVAILTAQFGWDVAFSALARLEGPEACAALWKTVEQLCTDEVR
jgi:geranylgeranyl pyrophosphate synthase